MASAPLLVSVCPALGKHFLVMAETMAAVVTRLAVKSPKRSPYPTETETDAHLARKLCNLFIL